MQYYVIWYFCNAFCLQIPRHFCMHIFLSLSLLYSPSNLLMGIRQALLCTVCCMSKPNTWLANNYTANSKIPRLSPSACMSFTLSAPSRTGPAYNDNTELSTSLQHLMNILAHHSQWGGHILFTGAPHLHFWSAVMCHWIPKSYSSPAILCPCHP